MFLIITFAIIVVTGISFLDMHDPEPIYPGNGVTRVARLSDYHAGLKGTAGDTEVYIFEGDNEGATMLVLGGTHPNEIAGSMTAVVLIENVEVDAGRLIVI